MEEYDDLISKELIDIILTQFYRVYNDLGYGFLEKSLSECTLFCSY
jgi:hypothetical protein